MIKKIWNLIRPYLVDEKETMLIELKDKTIRVQRVDGKKDQLSFKTDIICTIISIGICMLLAYSADKAETERKMNASKDYSKIESSQSAKGELIQYENIGAYLQYNSERISDYYPIIEEDFDSDMLRIIGSNGLYGYISKYNGEELIKPSFQEATPMNKNSACVSKDGENYFFIDEKGKRMTRDYRQAYPWENQGQYARVETTDGWAIINKKDEILLDQCTMINSLPEITAEGTALRDGKGVLFRINTDGQSETLSVVMEIPDVLEISELHYNSFAIIEKENGYGVVSAQGDILVDPVYEKITWEAIPFEDNEYGHKIIFKCKVPDGLYEIKNWDPRKN